MIFDCKVWPTQVPHPAFPKEKFHWAAKLPVKIFFGHQSTKPIEAWVDSGAPYCMFDTSTCQHLGIKVTKGIEQPLGGVIGGVGSTIYLHKVKLSIAGESFETMAGFAEKLSVPAILGRRGFFENFIVKFDSSQTPPQLELIKINRA